MSCLHAVIRRRNGSHRCEACGMPFFSRDEVSRCCSEEKEYYMSFLKEEREYLARTREMYQTMLDHVIQHKMRVPEPAMFIATPNTTEEEE